MSLPVTPSGAKISANPGWNNNKDTMGFCMYFGSFRILITFRRARKHHMYVEISDQLMRLLFCILVFYLHYTSWFISAFHTMSSFPSFLLLGWKLCLDVFGPNMCIFNLTPRCICKQSNNRECRVHSTITSESVKMINMVRIGFHF